MSVGRAATGAARGAARIVSAPLRVAQRNYAPLGKQDFLSAAGVFPADLGTSCCLAHLESPISGSAPQRHLASSFRHLPVAPHYTAGIEGREEGGGDDIRELHNHPALFKTVGYNGQ